MNRFLKPEESLIGSRLTERDDGRFSEADD